MSTAQTLAVSPGPPAAEARRFELARAQVRRSQLPVAVAHALVAGLVWQAGHPWSALAWWLAIGAVNLGRELHLQRLDFGRAADLAQAPRRMLAWLTAVGLLRPVPVLLSAATPGVESHYLITMVMLGLTVGGVSNLGGLPRLYLVWSGPLFVALCGLWLWRADAVGLGIAVLLALLFVLLASYVRDYGRLLAREAELAASLLAERDRANAAVEAKTRFFAAASHDLRQPLAALRWHADALQLHARQRDDAGLARLADGIVRALDRSEPLLGQYLEIARLDGAGTAASLSQPAHPLQLQRVDVAELLTQTAEAWAEAAARRGLALKLQLAAPSLPVWGEAEALRRMLDNLVGNALKFTPSGEVCLEAAPEAADATRLRLAVRDTGIGIAPEHQQRVFDDFVQLQPAGRGRTAEHGVGLGLAIARRQAERLGSRLQLDSRPGQGSCFHWSLALADPPRD